MAYAYRIRKNRAKRLLNKILESRYFMSCGFHPVQLTEYRWHKWDYAVSGVILSIGGEFSCWFKNCIPEPISEIVASEMVKIWHAEGARGLVIQYGEYSTEAYDAFIREWR